MEAYIIFGINSNSSQALTLRYVDETLYININLIYTLFHTQRLL